MTFYTNLLFILFPLSAIKSSLINLIPKHLFYIHFCCIYFLSHFLYARDCFEVEIVR